MPITAREQAIIHRFIQLLIYDDNMPADGSFVKRPGGPVQA